MHIKHPQRPVWFGNESMRMLILSAFHVFLMLIPVTVFASEGASRNLSVINNSQQDKKFSLISGKGQFEFALPETGSGAVDGDNFTALYITGHFSNASQKSKDQNVHGNSAQILTQKDNTPLSVDRKAISDHQAGNNSSNSDVINVPSNSNPPSEGFIGSPGSIDASGNFDSSSNASDNQNNGSGTPRRPREHGDIDNLGTMNELEDGSGVGMGPGASEDEQGASGSSALTINFQDDHLEVMPNVAVTVRADVTGEDLNNLHVLWTMLDGPAEPVIENRESTSTVMIFSEAGEYAMSLRAVTDSESTSAVLSVSVVARRQQILYVSAESQAEEPDGSTEFPFRTIQKAIDSAGSGARIQVSQGVYTGSDDPAVFLVDIDSKSNLTIVGGYEAPGVGDSDPVRFPTIIDGQNVPRNRFLMRIIDSTGSLSGFEFRGATGGAIKINRATFRIEKCNFHDNQNTRPDPNTAGAIYVTQSDGVTIGYSRFTSNSSASKGGAVRVDNSNAYLYDSYFFGNHSASSGGAIYNFGAVFNINHSTFSGNYADEEGAGDTIHNEYGSIGLTNSIIWNGTEPVQSIHFVDMESATSVRYSVVQYGFDGEGNLSSDPRFVDPNAGVLHLTAHSPAIEAGDPLFVESEFEMTDGEGDLRRVGSRVDMGFDEYSSVRGDMDRDGELNDADIDLFSEALNDPANFRMNYPDLNPLTGDMNYDGRLDNSDIDPFMCAVTGNC